MMVICLIFRLLYVCVKGHSAVVHFEFLEVFVK